MIENISGARNKLKEMREKVANELKHIPRGNLYQNELRSFYQSMRMHSLGKYSKIELSKEDVLKQAIDLINKDYPEFKPIYDTKFFLIKK
jgi:hypothetical protein